MSRNKGFSVIWLLVGLAALLALGVAVGRLVQKQEGVKVEEKMNGDKEMADLPAGMGGFEGEVITLEPVAGEAGNGMATRIIEEGLLVHTVTAELPELNDGSFYEGWLVRQSPFDVVYTGKLSVAKGGWVLEYSGEAAMIDHETVVVTRETVDDQKPEAHVVEGSF